MTGPTQKVVRLRITGRVQGVWYRGWTVGQARDLDLAGWVRNRSDGSVEALVSGPAEAVDRLISACYDGPPAAQVDQVDVTAVNVDVPGPGFHQRPST